MTTKTVTLPLAPDAWSFLKNLSSDQYGNLVVETFMPADLAYTFFFRYPRLMGHDIPANDNTNGFAIDFTSTGARIYAIFITLTIAGLAAANFYREYRRQKRAHKNTSYQFIHDELRRQGQFNEELAQELEAKIAHQQHAAEKKWLEDFFKKTYENDEKLKAKYSSINLTDDNLILKLKNPEEKQVPKNKSHWFRRIIINKVVSPLWEMLGISAFAYWLLWIGAGIFTGIFKSGVTGVPASIGFGIPFAFGAVYGLFKSYRWYKNHRAQKVKTLDDPTLEEESTAQKDACDLFRKAVLCRRFELANAELRKELGKSAIVRNDRNYSERKSDSDNLISDTSRTLDQKKNYLAAGAKRKAATAFLSRSFSTYVGVQYAAWIVTDVLAAAAKVTAGRLANIVFGWLFIAGSLAYGLCDGIRKYKSVKEYETQLKTKVVSANFAAMTLEAEYRSKVDRIKALKKNLRESGGDTKLPHVIQFDHPQFFNNVERHGHTKSTRFKKAAVRLLQFINGITAGAFVIRVFLVKGTAIFLPFAAAALSNPVTIGLVVGLGVAYGLFKMYEYHQRRKEAHAQQIVAQYGERINCLKKQIEWADLAVQVLEKRRVNVSSSTLLPFPNEKKEEGRNLLEQPLSQAERFSPEEGERRFCW